MSVSVEPRGRSARRSHLNSGNKSSGGSFRDVVGALADRGSLTPRQMAAGDRLYSLLQRFGGQSGGLVSGYNGRIDAAAPPHKRGIPMAFGDPAQVVLDHLQPSQRRLLVWLVTYSERPTGRRALHYYVTEKLGLDVPRQTASGIAQGMVSALLEAVADVFDKMPSPRPDPAHDEIARRVAKLIKPPAMA